jgi:hypothetical protein
MPVLCLKALIGILTEELKIKNTGRFQPGV